MAGELTPAESPVGVERRRSEVQCISCPICTGEVPVLARCVDGDVEPVLECRTCGWTRAARRQDVRTN